MKILINVVLAVLILLELATLLFWLMAIASGHRIPSDTTNKILMTLVVLGGLIWILIYTKRLDKKASELKK